MSEFLNCEVCGAPATVAWTGTMGGVDFDGTDAIFTIERVNCARGCWYTQVGEVVRDPT